MSIEVRNITKTFGNFCALKDVSLQVREGELLALLGPSGSGKTTLMRIIAGLESPDPNTNSQVLFHNNDVMNQAVGQRKVGFVFQHYALFRHMSVFENIAFGLRVRPRKERPSKSEISDRVQGLLKLVQLEQFGNRLPSQLSGGQRQRVALARALAVEPKVLLLDEPFGALDAKVRQGLRTWLRNLHHEINLTSILVTHDQEEALEVADRVVVMNQAKIEQIGTPEEVFHHPASPFVMEFLGQVNVFHSRIEGGHARVGNLVLKVPEFATSSDQPANVYMRPHELDILRSSDHIASIPARILRVNPAGSVARIYLESKEGKAIHVDLSLERYRELALQHEEWVHIVPRNARVFIPDFVI